MSGLLGLGGKRARTLPVTNPVRILLVDADPRSGTALSRAIDLDRELAVVGYCSNPKRAADEIKRCRPDIVAVRFGLDDDRCTTILTALAMRDDGPCVIVLGAPDSSAENAEVDAGRLKTRIRAVAEANFNLPPEPVRPDRLLH